MHDLEIVDVHADREDLAVGRGQREDARVRVIERLEVLLAQPLEQHALQIPACLLDTIDGLHYLGELGSTRAVVLRVASGEMAIHDFAVDEASLKVGSDEIDASNGATVARSEGEKSASGGVA